MKKTIALFLTFCLVFSLAACGSSGLTGSNPADSSVTPSVEKPTLEAPRETELNIMMSFPQYMEQWETYCHQFEAKVLEEDNIKLTINLEMPSSDQYESVLQARLSGNDAPDLYTLHSNNLKAFSTAGHLTDLSSEPLAEKLFANVASTVKVDGKLMGLPIESGAWGVLYNKAIFEECGLEVPNTLDELKNVCDVLTEKGYTPFMLAFQEQWVPQLMTALTLGGKVSGEVPDWVERMYKNEGSYKEMKEIFNVIDLIMVNGTKRAMEQGSEVGAADFANGKSAMFVQGTWAANTIMTTNPEMKLGVYALPINNNKQCTMVNLATSTTLAVHPENSEKELALKFANYVLDDTDSATLFKACGFNPISTIHTYEVPSWISDAYAYVEDGRAYQDLVLPSSVTDLQGKLLQEYYVKSATVDQMIERLDKAFKEANVANN